MICLTKSCQCWMPVSTDGRTKRPTGSLTPPVYSVSAREAKKQERLLRDVRMSCIDEALELRVYLCPNG
jgi:hypothetical protein